MKYVIDIEDKPCNEPFSESIWRAKNFRTLVFDKVGLMKLTPLADAIGDVISMEREQAYREGFDNGEQEGYDKAHAEEEELKGIILDFLKSMVKGQTESKCKPEVRIFDSCEDCVHGDKPVWAIPCIDCKHRHEDCFERKA